MKCRITHNEHGKDSGRFSLQETDSASMYFRLGLYC